MVGARSAPANAEPADFFPFAVKQDEAAAKHIDSADWPSKHRVAGGAEGLISVLVGRRAVWIVISVKRINRVAELKAE